VLIANRYKKTLLAFSLVCTCTAATWLALAKPPLLEGISFSQCVRDRNGKLLRVTLTTDQKFRVWTSLPDISPALVDATVRFEDKYYRHHPGVNPVALLRSALNLGAGGAHSGASTITMQLARLRYHLCTRTLGGKFVQIVRALELERHYSKAEILEAYLNLAPYGRNIEGIGAASQIYLDKPASRLSRPEAVALSVIPQSPSRRALFADRDNHSLDSAQSHWYDRAKINREFSVRLFSARAALCSADRRHREGPPGNRHHSGFGEAAVNRAPDRRLYSNKSQSRNSECCRSARRYAYDGCASTNRLGRFFQRRH